MAEKVLQLMPAVDGFKAVGVKYRSDEHCEQVVVVQWAAWMCYRARRGEAPGSSLDLEWLFAIPNGGERDRIVAGRMKAEGVKSGVSDLCLPVARGGFFGLFIEMKRFDGGTVSENQTQFLEFVGRHGYANAICYGMEQAVHTLKRYLDLPYTKESMR